MGTEQRDAILSRRKLARTFSVSRGFVEGLERTGKIHPKDFYVGRQLWKAFTAKDVNTIRNEALGSAHKSCRLRGEKMNLHLASKG